MVAELAGKTADWTDYLFLSFAVEQLVSEKVKQTWFGMHPTFGLSQVVWKGSVIHPTAASGDPGLAQVVKVAVRQIVVLEVNFVVDAVSEEVEGVLGYQRNVVVG